VENCRGPFYERLDALSGILAGHNAIPDFRHRANFKIPVDLVCDLQEFAKITQGIEVFSQAGEMSVGRRGFLWLSFYAHVTCSS